MNVYYPPGTVQYALRINCERQGCLDPHEDKVYRQLDPRLPWEQEQIDNPALWTINGHAADLFMRVIPDWTKVERPT